MATDATSRHHWAASPAVFGGLAIVMNTLAPRSASRFRRISVFARYCAVVAVHGAGVWAPKSSFSAIHGVAQPVTVTAKSNRRSAFATIPAGSAGSVGVPTRLLKFRSKKIVAAPAARAAAGFSVPDVKARVSPGFCGNGASWPAKSTHTGFPSGIPHSRALAFPEKARPIPAMARTTAIRRTP